MVVGFVDRRVTEGEVDGINCYYAAGRADGIGDRDGEIALTAADFEDIGSPGNLPELDEILAVRDGCEVVGGLTLKEAGYQLQVGSEMGSQGDLYFAMSCTARDF